MNPVSDKTIGVLFVGHGTRSVRGTQDFLTLAERLAASLPEFCVEPAFLELQSPDIAEGVRRLIENGVDRLLVLPLLLFSAGHAKEDVPDAVAKALDALMSDGLSRAGELYSRCAISWNQAPHLGCHPSLLELTCRRIATAMPTGLLEPGSAVDSGRPVPQISSQWQEDTCLVMLGRGSRDPSATQEMHAYAAETAKMMGFRHHRVGFVAMAQPSMTSVLGDLAGHTFRNLVVVPHLLFDGDLLGQIQGQLEQLQAETPDKDWFRAGILGHDVGEAHHEPHLLVQALRQTALEAAKAAFSGGEAARA